MTPPFKIYSKMYSTKLDIVWPHTEMGWKIACADYNFELCSVNSFSSSHLQKGQKLAKRCQQIIKPFDN